MLLHLLLYVSAWEFGESATSQQINRTLSVVLVPESNVSVIGRTEIISCRSFGGQVPITYYLFRHRNTRGRISTTEDREVKFNVTIGNVSLLGPYKCKVNDSADISYSSEFNFTLRSQEDAPSNAQNIILLSSVVAVFLVFLVVIVLSVVYFKCIRGHQTNSDQVFEAVRYTGSEKTSAPDVSYTTLILNDGIGKIIRKEDSVEYVTVAKRH